MGRYTISGNGARENRAGSEGQQKYGAGHRMLQASQYAASNASAMSAVNAALQTKTTVIAGNGAGMEAKTGRRWRTGRSGVRQRAGATPLRPPARTTHAQGKRVRHRSTEASPR